MCLGLFDTGRTMKSTTVPALVIVVLLAALVTIVYLYRGEQTTEVSFAYQRATERDDGTPLLLDEIKYTRLYCDGMQVAEETGADGDLSATLAAGYHDCYGTHVDTNELESMPGETLRRFVELEVD